MKIIAGMTANGVTYSTFDLVEFERRVATGPGTYTSTFYRYCNAMGNLTYNLAATSDMPSVGSVFTSRSFDRGAIIQSSRIAGSMQIAFDDHDDLFKTLALAFDLLDWRVRVWNAGVTLNTSSILWVNLKIAGRCEDSEIDVEGDNVFRLEVSYDAAGRVNIGPRQKYGPNCAHRFTDARCGHPGGPGITCNRTWTRCGELLNQARYGGYRKIPAADDALPTWGGESQEIGQRRYRTTPF